jgi:hypothetical protein
MKTRMIFFTAVAVILGVMVAGCGSSKSQSSVAGAKEIKQNACEEYQLASPATRAVGTGTHFKEATARNIAEVQARAQFARAIATAITASTSEEAMGYEQYSGEVKTGDKVTDQGSKVNDMAQGIAKETIANTVVVKTVKFLLPNNQYEVWVCLEYQAGVEALASNVAKKVQQRISDEDKMKMNFEFDQYRKRVEAELEKSQQ